MLQAIYGPVKSTAWLKQLQNRLFLSTKEKLSSMIRSPLHCYIYYIFPDTPQWRGWEAEQGYKIMPEKDWERKKDELFHLSI